ncbi:MAG: BamA/TamA family outer membrane protein, partial [Candidatus Eisenbacteria bacterium]|nr:BamA/TamA family outer membrane protein [Candidatus Eisenbacteria bacterium]
GEASAAPSLRGYRIGLIDPESGRITEVPGFDGAKHIDPHWSRDGASLYFVSDRGGISDLYRVTLATGELDQLTHLTTGVSGLTSLSPAFTVARQIDRLIFSAYEKGSYNLYRLDGATPLAGAPPSAPVAAAAGTLPPLERENVTASVETPARTVSVDTLKFRRTPYRAALSLDNVSQVSLGVAGGSTGTHLAGGAAFYWSDMLGDHNLATAVQFLNAGGNFINNTGAILAYQNLASRWNWGLELSQVPYVASGFAELVDPATSTIADQETRYWEIDRSLLGDVAYPFDRFHRVEFTGGLRNIAFAQEIETRRFDSITGVLLSDKTVQVPNDSLASLYLATVGSALVYDNAVFGGTSPILGQRYRFEVDPVIGSLNFTEVLADYRRYVMFARPLTLAGRVLHFGRYGSGADDTRLSPLYVGYPSLVRGYDINSFTTDETVFNRLLGSRMAVANVELRVPLLGSLGLIASPAIPPLEAALFFDAGSAWSRGEKPRFFGAGARTVTSHGVAMRLNLFGFAVGEVDLVHPNDRPGRSWYWEFALQPGF